METVLGNGLKVITYKTDSDFVTINYTIDIGSVDEDPVKAGIAHLCEHLVFKGTANRTKEEINLSVEQCGGMINACTSREYTSFFVEMLKEHFDVGFDTLSDIVFNATIPEEEFDCEKAVVINELNMYKDGGENEVEDNFYRQLFGEEYPSWWNIGGTEETVSSITRDDVIAFIEKNYTFDNMFLTVVGNVEHEDVIKAVEQYTENFDYSGKVKKNREIDVSVLKNNMETVTTERENFLSHIYFGLPVEAECSYKNMVMLKMLSYIMSGGLSGKLIELREKYGLCYAIDTYANNYVNGVIMFTGYTGVDKSNINKTIENIERILGNIEITEKDFERAKNNISVAMKHRYTDTSDIAMFIISQTLNSFPYNKEKVEDIIEDITVDELRDFVDEYVSGKKLMFSVIQQA